MNIHYATEAAYKNGYEAGKKDALSKMGITEGKKQYLIDEDTLRELLRAGHILAILERDGVDNWWGWMEGREEYLTDCISELPWNEGKTIEDLNEIVEEEGYDIDDLVDDQIDAFWTPVPGSGDGYGVAGYGDAASLDI